ncbi:MAG TPA: DUF2325 domain-containing protein [Nitrospirota bacterium]|nr:DUF2325 domain-containing protein [Nitrospirota bacterium]
MSRLGPATTIQNSDKRRKLLADSVLQGACQTGSETAGTAGQCGSFFGAFIENENQFHIEEVSMCIALIGGMDRLERHYKNEAEKFGVDLKVFNASAAGIASKVKAADAVVIFTNKVSHRARKEVVTMARSRNIPVFQYHSCGVCTLRDCLNCLHKKGGVRNG